jgi:hypothetical protein
MGEIVMSLGGGFGKSKSSQQTSGESGVSGRDRALATQQAFRVLGSLEPIINQFRGGVPQLSLTNGLTPGAAGLAGALVNNSAQNLFSKLSGTGALRGQVNPQNTSSIIGSATSQAVGQALPQFIDQARGNELFNATAGQQTQAQGIQFLQGLASLFSGLTTGSSQSGSGKSSAFNFNTSFGL